MRVADAVDVAGILTFAIRIAGSEAKASRVYRHCCSARILEVLTPQQPSRPKLRMFRNEHWPAVVPPKLVILVIQCL